MCSTRGDDSAAAALVAAVNGGRVAFSGFLEPAAADALLARLRGDGVDCSAWGGFPAALRRVVAAYPSQVPEARAELTGWYVSGARPEGSLRALARAAGVAGDRLGDEVSHQDGATLVVLAPLPAALLTPGAVAGSGPGEASEVPLERVAAGSVRQVSAVVPSLRVDVLGARAFGVSRAYFAKGVAAGRVTVNGEAAGKSTSANVGDDVFAAGLGRFTVSGLSGETRRGNLKVTLMVERP